MRVGRQHGVNHVTLYKAAYVFARNKKLADQVVAGAMSVGAAEKQIRSAKDDVAPITDDNGNAVPSKLKKIFKSREAVDALEKAANSARKSLDSVSKSRVAEKKTLAEVTSSIDAILNFVATSRPSLVCRACNGKGCTSCSNKGWLPRTV